MKKVQIPADDGAKIVLTIATWAALPESPTTAVDDPPLNINHPSQRIRVPRTTCCGECGANFPSPSF